MRRAGTQLSRNTGKGRYRLQGKCNPRVHDGRMASPFDQEKQRLSFPPNRESPAQRRWRTPAGCPTAPPLRGG
jgi:hypothetical protein